MELTILHLYPDAMSLYGEYANVAILRRHLEALEVSVSVRTAASDGIPDFKGADFIYMGAGSERAQKAALAALSPHGDALKEALAAGAVLLFTGNAMELLGASVADAKGTVWPALKLAPFTTVETGKRIVEDVVAHTSALGDPVVGFMNKCSLTHGVAAPLFSHLTLGFGNDAPLGPEGYTGGNVFATHITGPLLVKNPAFTGLLIRRLFAAKGWPLPETLPILPHEREAYAVTLRELSARSGTK